MLATTVTRLEGFGGREGGTVTEILLELKETVEPDMAEYGRDGTKELGKDA